MSQASSSEVSFLSKDNTPVRRSLRISSLASLRRQLIHPSFGIVILCFQFFQFFSQFVFSFSQFTELLLKPIQSRIFEYSMRTPARRKFGLTTTMIKLNNDQVKQLLLEAEASPFLREKLKFRDICDRWPNFFGEPATDLRRTFQKRWNYLKSLPLQEYCDLTPSQSTIDTCLDIKEDTMEGDKAINTTMHQTNMDETSIQNGGESDDDKSDLFSTHTTDAVPICSPSPAYRKKKSSNGDASTSSGTAFGGERQV